MIEAIPGQNLEQPKEQMPQPIWDTKEYLEFVKHYSEDEIIPDEVKKSKWGIFGKALTYTFLEETDLPIIDIFSQLFRIDSLVTQPPHRITFHETTQISQSHFYMFLTAKRAIGTNREKMNERTLQNTQIAQTIGSQVAIAKKQGGFMSRLRGAF